MVNVGHGVPEVIDAVTAQLHRTQYVHGTMFTTEALEAYAAELAPLLPMDAPRLYPVSGGSEAVETALKLARAYHLARDEEARVTVIGRRSAYHGNTLGALDVSGKEPLRKPYTPWLGRHLHAPAAYEYRCPNPTHPDGLRRLARRGARPHDPADRRPRPWPRSSPSRWRAPRSAPPCPVRTTGPRWWTSAAGTGSWSSPTRS